MKEMCINLCSTTGKLLNLFELLWKMDSKNYYIEWSVRLSMVLYVINGYSNMS